MKLEIKNVSLSINRKLIVNNVSIHVSPGEIVGLLGPNGAGKTSTFNLIVGNLRPNKGEILLNNKRINNLSLPCLLYTSPSPRDRSISRMPSSA